MSSGRRALFRGAAWNAGATAFSHALGLTTSLITARVLGPQAFGAAGMALVVLALAATTSSIAIAPAIASGRMSDERTVWTGHWLLVALGGAVGAIVFVAAPAAARFFGDPAVAPLLRALAATLPLNAATIVAQALLQRAGRFGALAMLRAAQQLAIVAGTLVLVGVGAGIWILVVPGIAASALMVPAYWATLRAWPRPVLTWRGILPFLREGVEVTGHDLCNFVARNGDNAIVGKLCGAYALGLYGFAYNLLMRPLELFSHSVVPVLVPSFGRGRGDSRRVSDDLVHAATLVLRLGAPVLIGGALTCDLFVPLLFGPQWTAAVPVVRVLMVTGAVQLVGPVFGAMVLASGASAFLLRWGVWTALASTASFLVGARLAGPLGVAFAYLVYTVASIGTMGVLARRRFALPLVGLEREVGGVLRDLALMSAGVLAAGALARAFGAPAVARLAAEVGAGVVGYGAAFRTFARARSEELLSSLPPALAARGARLFRVAPRAEPIAVVSREGGLERDGDER